MPTPFSIFIADRELLVTAAEIMLFEGVASPYKKSIVNVTTE